MLYLLDTNAIGDMVRSSPKIDAKLASLGQADQAIVCTIVKGEILFGIERLPIGKRRQDLESKARKLLSGLICYDVSETVAEHYAHIKSETEGRGIILDENDLWIAATAISLGAVVITRDKAFGHIAGLQVEDWNL